ncbi:MAG: radical SAM protein [Verrucomicrobia bacterium]|nr:radical SAM protein [Verrucomicrobiota bacterium]
MIGITKLVCGTGSWGDRVRYEGAPQDPLDRRPVVVWTMTRRCNLNCIHCYSDSHDQLYPGELDDAAARKLIGDLAGFGCPVLLFSGGEPLLHPRLLEYIELAKAKGLRPVVSTNGTLIDESTAKRLAESGAGYVGISLDGVEAVNDRFRGKKGAFKAALNGFHACLKHGQKVGLRLTLTKRNVADLEKIFDLIVREGIGRACFYHLAYSGRGARLQDVDVTHAESRAAVEMIIEWARAHPNLEVLTVDNHADAAFLVMRLRAEGHPGAEDAYRLLQHNGGNQSGIAIACIDNAGNVHADQFLWDFSFGNVRERPFARIWADTADPVLAGLKNRAPLIRGRCAPASCRWFDICNANLRARAYATTGDVWESDPACYLTDAEIAT